MRHRERARMEAAMIEKFTKDVYNSLVLDRTDIHRRMYNSMTEETDKAGLGNEAGSMVGGGHVV